MVLLKQPESRGSLHLEDLLFERYIIGYPCIYKYNPAQINNIATSFVCVPIMNQLHRPSTGLFEQIARM